jgi:hypothetical protein
MLNMHDWIWFAIKRHNKTRAHDSTKEDRKMIIQEVPGRWPHALRKGTWLLSAFTTGLSTGIHA